MATSSVEHSSFSNANTLQCLAERRWLEHIGQVTESKADASHLLHQLCSDLLWRLEREIDKTGKLRRHLGRLIPPPRKNQAPSLVTPEPSALQSLVNEQAALLEKLYAENSELRIGLEKAARLNHLLNTANERFKRYNIELRRELKTHVGDKSEHGGMDSSPTSTPSNNSLIPPQYEVRTSDDMQSQSSWFGRIVMAAKNDLDHWRLHRQAEKQQERRSKIRRVEDKRWLVANKGNAAQPSDDAHDKSDPVEQWMLHQQDKSSD